MFFICKLMFLMLCRTVILRVTYSTFNAEVSCMCDFNWAVVLSTNFDYFQRYW